MHGLTKPKFYHTLTSELYVTAIICPHVDFYSGNSSNWRTATKQLRGEGARRTV